MRYAFPLLLLATALPAWADDDEPRKRVECMPVDEVAEQWEEFAEIDPEDRQVVDIRPDMFLYEKDGLGFPEQIFLQTPRGEQISFPISADGEVGDGTPGHVVMTVVREGGGRLCAVDPAREGLTREEAEGYGVTLGLLPQVLDRDGSHTLAELKRGGKEGRGFFKKMAPGAFSFLVPKLDHYAVSHPRDDKDNLPTVRAFRGTEDLGPVSMEPFDVSQLLSLDALEDMGADRIEVSGPYRLYPMPDAKTVRRFMSDDD